MKKIVRLRFPELVNPLKKHQIILDNKRFVFYGKTLIMREGNNSLGFKYLLNESVFEKAHYLKYLSEQSEFKSIAMINKSILNHETSIFFAQKTYQEKIINVFEYGERIMVELEGIESKAGLVCFPVGEFSEEYWIHPYGQITPIEHLNKIENHDLLTISGL